MLLVSVLHPNQPGTRFDERYFVDQHIKLVRQRWDAMGLREVRLLRGVSTPDGGAAPYRVVALLSFVSADALQQAMAAHGAEINADIPRFADVLPIVQINEALA